MYKEGEVKKKTIEYFDGDELATNVWMDKYALKDKENNFLETSPSDMHYRIAKELLRIEKQYPNPLSIKDITLLLDRFKYFIPAGSCMFGIGNPVYSSLANCFVISNEADSYGGICTTDEEQIQLMKRRGGVGHDLSHIRPKGSLTSNAAKTSTGILPFMERFSNSTKEVAQDGRRGALMLSLDINHPGIEDFIVAKDDLTKITGANISVKINNKFMEAVKNNKDHTTFFPIKSTNISDKLDTIYDMYKAKSLWDKIIHQSWKSAEPGILFWDKIIEESPADCYEEFKTVGVNPCGEVPLCAYDSCRLGHINLYSFVNKPFTNEASFNFQLFKEKTKQSVRLMDDIIDLEKEKIENIIDKIIEDPEINSIKQTELNLWDKIYSKLKKGRRIGLGVLGLADVLAALNMNYAMPETEPFIEKLFNIFSQITYKSSIELAKERGSFPIFDFERERNNPFINRLLKNTPELKTDYELYGKRNIALLTIAPTGTVSIMSQISSGIEPVFKISYTRRRKVTKETEKTYKDNEGILWEDNIVIHKPFKEWLLIKYPEIDLNTITEKEIDTLVTKSPYCENTTNEINPLYKVDMQGIIQKYIDHSISITYNLPENTTKEKISQLCFIAWEKGCKGITIYREGSRQGVLVSNTKKFNSKNATKRPIEVKCDIHRPIIKGIKWIVLIGLIDNHPYEVFAFKQNGDLISNNIKNGIIKKIKKNTKTEYSLLSEKREVLIKDIVSNIRRPSEEWSTRLISGMLRHHANPKFIYKQLYKAPGHITDYAKCIARTLKKYLNTEEIISVSKCINCGSKNLSHQDGCLICLNCGNSNCS